MRSKAILMVVFLFMIVPTQARIIYVDANTPDNNDGSNWAKAYKYLQDALADANTSGDVNEILVAQGIYNPDANSSFPDGNGDRTATFQLINGVALRGGYAGFGEPDPNVRDIELYETILSGDLNGDDGPDFENNDENSKHVMTGSGTNETAVLNGFTVTAGNANGGWPNNCGGGMFNGNNSYPSVINCTFTGNSAGYWGGGMLNYHNGGSSVTNCMFTNNCAYKGGGIYNDEDSDSTVTNSIFSNNSASNSGGGMYNEEYTSPLVTNCIFNGNSAGDRGGGIHNDECHHPTIVNCTFVGNWAGGRGPAVSSNDCYPILTNCIFWANWANDRPHPISKGSDAVVSITYSDVQWGWSGKGNIKTDPCFAEPGYWADVNDPNIVVEPNDPNAIWIDGDYHLKSQAGRYDRDSQTWILDALTSPCIDAGNPSSSIGWELFPNGGIVNMGAYGGTEKASKSYFGTPVCDKPIAGDINGDCVVDWRDFAIMAYHWLEDNNE